MWRALGAAPHEGHVFVDVPKPCRYGYKSFTLPDWRGRRIQSQLARSADPWYIARGYTHAIGFIESDNYASLHSNRKHGNRTVGWAVRDVRDAVRKYPRLDEPEALREWLLAVSKRPEGGAELSSFLTIFADAPAPRSSAGQATHSSSCMTMSLPSRSAWISIDRSASPSRPRV